MRRYQALGQQWAGMAPVQGDYGQANGYLGMGDAARAQQMQALGLMQARATGQAPSIAAMQAQRALSQGLANSQAQVASARGGPGAMALAARGGMMNNAQLTGDVAGQSAIAAAQERQAAEQAYLQGAGGIRQQDYGAAGMTGGWAQNNAELQMQQRQLALQGQMGFEGMGQNVGMAQLAAAQQQEAMRQGKWQAQMGADAASQANANANLKTGVGVALGAATGGLGAITMMNAGGGGGGGMGGGGYAGQGYGDSGNGAIYHNNPYGY
jgi:hypothetical protein